MTKHTHTHQQSDSHDHQHGHHRPGWKPHSDWRVWTVALMLLAMAVYVLTLNESIWPGGQAVPAAPAPVDAP